MDIGQLTQELNIAYDADNQRWLSEEGIELSFLSSNKNPMTVERLEQVTGEANLGINLMTGRKKYFSDLFYGNVVWFMHQNGDYAFHNPISPEDVVARAPTEMNLHNTVQGVQDVLRDLYGDDTLEFRAQPQQVEVESGVRYITEVHRLSTGGDGVSEDLDYELHIRVGMPADSVASDDVVDALMSPECIDPEIYLRVTDKQGTLRNYVKDPLDEGKVNVDHYTTLVRNVLSRDIAYQA